MRPSAVKVLHNEAGVAVIDKPSGLLVIPSPRGESLTLTRIVNESLMEDASSSGRWHPCHRLDRGTSGVIVYAHGKATQRAVMGLFHRREVEKRYVVFVRGGWRSPRGEIRDPIFDDAASARRKGRAARGRKRPACTRYRLKERCEGFSVLDVWPETGRTNQIRIHFSRRGHPVLGDRLYAFGRDFPVSCRRLALHAAEIVFRHPVTGVVIRVEASLPEDLRTLWREGRRKK